jgi:hypothetical protein
MLLVMIPACFSFVLLAQCIYGETLTVLFGDIALISVLSGTFSVFVCLSLKGLHVLFVKEKFGEKL